MKKVNWGILGLGNIGFKFSESFGNLKNAKLKSVSSRNREKLIKFGKQNGIEKEFLFENYYDLIKCNDIDIIYIALPNSLHYYWIIECIKNNKKILIITTPSFKKEWKKEIKSISKNIKEISNWSLKLRIKKGKKLKEFINLNYSIESLYKKYYYLYDNKR